MKIKLVDENLGNQLGLSKFISPECPFDKNEDNPDIVIFTDRLCYSDLVDTYNCKKIAWIIEPPIINGENHVWMRQEENYKKFDIVCTYNKSLENVIPNFKFVPHGGTWIREQDINLYEKSKCCSFIFSDKNWNGGHKARHRAYAELLESIPIIEHTNGPDIDYYGTGPANPVEFKIDSLKDYRWSIAMENSREDDYFTEKIIDCFLTGCIPIYNGTKNIINYFDEDGIILFNEPEELPDIISSLNNNTYLDKIDSIKANFEKAKQYMHPENEIITILKNE